MKCRCGKKAVAEIKHLNKYLCKNCFIKSLEKRFKDYVLKNRLITKKEKIAVGVSGGKDSLTCLYLVQKHFKNASAITIDEGIKGYRKHTIPAIEKYCREWGCDHSIFSFKNEFGYSLDKIIKKLKMHPCSICGVLRRYLINKKAKELGFDKLATGHNLDDEAQSILMNLYLSNFMALIRLGPTSGILKHKRFVQRIKPLRLVSEKEILTFFLLRRFEKSYVECPYVTDSFRNKIRNNLNLIGLNHPAAKYNIVNNFDSIKPKLKKEKYEISACSECGEPTSTKICRACQIIKKLKN